MAFKKCVICGKGFETKCGQKTCSLECRAELYGRWHVDHHRALRADPERWAAALAKKLESSRKRKLREPEKIKAERRGHYERHKEAELAYSQEYKLRRRAEQERLENELWQRIFDYYLKGAGKC